MCAIVRCVFYSCTCFFHSLLTVGATGRLKGFSRVIFRCGTRRRDIHRRSIQITYKLTAVSSSQTSGASSFAGATHAGATLTGAAFERYTHLRRQQLTSLRCKHMRLFVSSMAAQPLKQPGKLPHFSTAWKVQTLVNS